MSLSDLENYYDNLTEPNKSCCICLRSIFFNIEEMSERFSYKLPFFYYKNKPFCYLYYDKDNSLPYIGYVKANLIEHALLIKGNRKKMKVLYIDPLADIPLDTLKEINNMLFPFYLKKKALHRSA